MGHSWSRVGDSGVSNGDRYYCYECGACKGRKTVVRDRNGKKISEFRPAGPCPGSDTQ